MKTVLCLSLCVQHAMPLAVLDPAASRQKLENEYLSVAAAFTPWKAVCTFSAARARACRDAGRRQQMPKHTRGIGCGLKEGLSA